MCHVHVYFLKNYRPRDGKNIVIYAKGNAICKLLSASINQRLYSKMLHYAGVDYNPPYVDSRVNSNTRAMVNPMPQSILTRCQSRLYPLVRDFEFGL